MDQPLDLCIDLKFTMDMLSDDVCLEAKTKSYKYQMAIGHKDLQQLSDVVVRWKHSPSASQAQ